MEIIQHEAAQKANLTKFWLALESDGTYDLQYILPSLSSHDIKNGLKTAVHRLHIKNICTICEYLKKPENISVLDLETVIFAINSEKYEIVKTVVPVFLNKPTVETQQDKPQNTLKLNTVFIAMANWDLEIALFVTSVFLKSDNARIDEKDIEKRYLKDLLLILLDDKSNIEKFKKTIATYTDIKTILHNLIGKIYGTPANSNLMTPHFPGLFFNKPDRIETVAEPLVTPSPTSSTV